MLQSNVDDSYMLCLVYPSRAPGLADHSHNARSLLGNTMPWPRYAGMERRAFCMHHQRISTSQKAAHG